MIHTQVNAKTVISHIEEKDIQPNAIDIKLESIFKIDTDLFVIDEDNKKHRKSTKMDADEDGYFTLPVGSYEVIMKNKVDIAENEVGWVITRSTLNRNGVFITSGLYDSGYKGIIAGVMHVTCGPMKVKTGTRIGQFLIFNSEMVGEGYNGDYGDNKQHDKKYK